MSALDAIRRAEDAVHAIDAGRPCELSALKFAALAALAEARALWPESLVPVLAQRAALDAARAAHDDAVQRLLRARIALTSARDEIANWTDAQGGDARLLARVAATLDGGLVASGPVEEPATTGGAA